jgi:hypothetical protein
VALAFDLDKDDLARQSPKRILDTVASERMAIAGAHVAAPGFAQCLRTHPHIAGESHGASRFRR